MKLPGKIPCKNQPQDLFDPRFFGISSNEAAAIDPQQRHVLEVAYAACHDAGRSRKELTKKSIGPLNGNFLCEVLVRFACS